MACHLRNYKIDQELQKLSRFSFFKSKLSDISVNIIDYKYCWKICETHNHFLTILKLFYTFSHFLHFFYTFLHFLNTFLHFFLQIYLIDFLLSLNYFVPSNQNNLSLLGGFKLHSKLGLLICNTHDLMLYS